MIDTSMAVMRMATIESFKGRACLLHSSEQLCEAAKQVKPRGAATSGEVNPASMGPTPPPGPPPGWPGSPLAAAVLGTARPPPPPPGGPGQAESSTPKATTGGRRMPEPCVFPALTQLGARPLRSRSPAKAGASAPWHQPRQEKAPPVAPWTPVEPWPAGFSAAPPKAEPAQARVEPLPAGISALPVNKAPGTVKAAPPALHLPYMSNIICSTRCLGVGGTQPFGASTSSAVSS